MAKKVPKRPLDVADHSPYPGAGQSLLSFGLEMKATVATHHWLTLPRNDGSLSYSRSRLTCRMHLCYPGGQIFLQGSSPLVSKQMTAIVAGDNVSKGNKQILHRLLCHCHCPLHISNQIPQASSRNILWRNALEFHGCPMTFFTPWGLTVAVGHVHPMFDIC